MSVLVHGGLIGLLLLISAAGTAAPPPLEVIQEVTIEPGQVDEPHKADPLIATDID